MRQSDPGWEAWKTCSRQNAGTIFDARAEATSEPIFSSFSELWWARWVPRGASDSLRRRWRWSIRLDLILLNASRLASSQTSSNWSFNTLRTFAWAILNSQTINNTNIPPWTLTLVKINVWDAIAVLTSVWNTQEHLIGGEESPQSSQKEAKRTSIDTEEQTRAP